MQFTELFEETDPMYKINGKSLSDYIEHVYGMLIEINSMKIKENELKVRNHS